MTSWAQVRILGGRFPGLGLVKDQGKQRTSEEKTRVKMWRKQFGVIMPDLGDNCSALSRRKRAAARNSSVTKPDVAREGKKLREGAKKFCERETKNFTFGNTVVPSALQFCRFQNNAKARRGKPAKSRPPNRESRRRHNFEQCAKQEKSFAETCLEFSRYLLLFSCLVPCLRVSLAPFEASLSNFQN